MVARVVCRAREACGSPGEVANDPSLGWKYTMLMSSLYESSEQGELTDQYYSRTNGKQMPWYQAGGHVLFSHACPVDEAMFSVSSR